MSVVVVCSFLVDLPRQLSLYMLVPRRCPLVVECTCVFNIIINEGESASRVQTRAAAAFADGSVGTSVLKYLSPRQTFGRMRCDIPSTKESGGFCAGHAEVILPHELWQSLSQPEKSSRFHEIFGSSEDWRQWWRAVEGETRFEDHAFKQWIKDNPDLACPFIIHGNSAPIGKWGSADCVC